MDEDKPNAENGEICYVFSNGFVSSCCNSLRDMLKESALRALWDMQVLQILPGIYDVHNMMTSSDPEIL